MEENPVAPSQSSQPVKPIPQVPAAPIVPPSPVDSSSPNVVKSGGGRKKIIMILIFALVILAAVGGVGYYYLYAYNKSPETTYMAPSPEPSVPTPTILNAIKDDSELDLMITDLDSASEDAQMDAEVKSLQTDSNF